MIKIIILTLHGNTFGIKSTLKGLGFKWNPQTKGWSKSFKDSEESTANELSTRWLSEGVYSEITKH